MWRIEDILHPHPTMDFLREITNISSCSQLTTCNTCANYELIDCAWCATTKNCVSAGSRAGTCSSQFIGSCSDSYYTIIFLVILASMLCVCCLTCYFRRWSSHRDMSDLFSPLLSRETRRAIFEDRAGEWMCVICGFDNKSRSKDCIMCGTSHQFSTEYKTTKKEQRRQKKLNVTKISGLHQNQPQRASATASSAPNPTPRTSFISSALNNTKSRSNSRTTNNLDTERLLPIAEDGPDDYDATKQALFNANIDIPIPEDAQITSISMSLRNFDTVTSNNNNNYVINNAALLTNEEREEAMNYRRMNQLTLRQKSARRRKLWQRKLDKRTGHLIWMRVPVKDTKVGSAPFGYTPRPSISESRRQETSQRHSVFSMLSSSIHFSDSFNNEEELHQAQHNSAIADLLSAARAGGSDSPFANNNNYNYTNNASMTNPQCMSPPPSGRIPFRPIAADSESNPNNHMDDNDDAMTVRSNLGRVTPQRRTRPNVNNNNTNVSPSKLTNFFNSLRFPGLNSHQKDRRWSKDSFDSAVVSTSPGYTAVFDEEGGLTWKRVESGMPVAKNHYGDTIARPANNNNNNTNNSANATNNREGNDSPDIENGTNNDNNNITNPPLSVLLHDLPTIASFTFREKQIWFLDRISELQKPWSEGFVKMEVRRAKLLDDSHRAWSQLRDVDMHKWFRFQFANEPGIDAGGLEREWFALLMEEIFAPSNGLFLPCGSAGGSFSSNIYHINPISGAINPNHLSYFQFIGRVLGKALMTQQSIRANLSLPLRKQIIGSPVTFSDLEFVDDELYKNLIWMKTQENEGHSEVIESLSLDFSISYTAANQTVTYDLIENGSNVPVTAENLDEYLQLRLRHRLLDSVKLQLEHLLRGLYEVIPPEWLSVFDYQELDLLLCGVPQLDLQDWMQNTDYLGEYKRLGGKHHVIKMFWKSVENMTNEERVRLLQFTTGCARLPVQGFKALQSSDGRYRKFNIQCVAKSEAKYPRAHTCFNKLDLPQYESQAEMDAFLSFVINMDITGFSME